jgi:hypothetical protein
MSPAKKDVKNATTDNDEIGGEFHGNEEADRALFGVKKKLTSNLSVETHVSSLIQAATNPNNLSRMFPGWQPYL